MVVYLEHHYGWQQYRIKGVSSLKDAAYKAVLNSHTFLTNNNHSKKITNGVVSIIRNKKSDKAVLKPLWYDDSVGSTWFSVNFSAIKH
jgi:hypothetical protein